MSNVGLQQKVWPRLKVCSIHLDLGLALSQVDLELRAQSSGIKGVYYLSWA